MSQRASGANIREHLLEAAGNASPEAAEVLRTVAGSSLMDAISEFGGGECYLATPPSPLHSELGQDGLKMCCEHPKPHCAVIGRLSESLAVQVDTGEMA